MSIGVDLLRVRSRQFILLPTCATLLFGLFLFPGLVLNNKMTLGYKVARLSTK